MKISDHNSPIEIIVFVLYSTTVYQQCVCLDGAVVRVMDSHSCNRGSSPYQGKSDCTLCYECVLCE